jgi:hypothetical protein
MKSLKIFGKILLDILRIILVGIAIYLFFKNDLFYGISALITATASFIPILLEKFDIKIPWFIEFIILVSLMLHLLGGLFNWYVILGFYSSTVHFLTSAGIALIFYSIIYSLNRTKYLKLSYFMTGLFVFMLVLGIGSMWEVGEFGFDKYLHTHLQGDSTDPLTDTMIDLLFDGIGALFIAIFGKLIIEHYHDLSNSFINYLRKRKK